MKKSIFVWVALAASCITLEAQTLTIASTGAGSVTSTFIDGALLAAGISDPTTVRTIVVNGTLNKGDFGNLKNYNGNALKLNATTVDLSAVVLSGPDALNGSFWGYAQLATATLPENGGSDYYIDSNGFNSCSKLSTLNFPTTAKITKLNGSSFKGCVSLVRMVLPEGMTAISNTTNLDGCTALTYLEIPSTMETIQGGSFGNCPALQKVYCKASTVPTSGSAIFSGTTPQSIVVYVPEGSVGPYKDSSRWGGFVTDKETQILPETALNIGASVDRTYTVRAIDGGVLVEELDGTVLVELYSLSGSRLQSVWADGSVVLPVSGVVACVVTVDGVTQKVILK